MIQNRFSNSNFVARKTQCSGGASRAKLRTHFKLLTIHERRIGSEMLKKGHTPHIVNVSSGRKSFRSS